MQDELARAAAPPQHVFDKGIGSSIFAYPSRKAIDDATEQVTKIEKDINRVTAEIDEIKATKRVVHQKDSLNLNIEGDLRLVERKLKETLDDVRRLAKERRDLDYDKQEKATYRNEQKSDITRLQDEYERMKSKGIVDQSKINSETDLANQKLSQLEMNIQVTKRELDQKKKHVED